MRRSTLAAAAAVVFLASSGTAQAVRPGSPEEKGAVSVQALNRTPGLYFSLMVSTVDPTWARADHDDIGMEGVADDEAVLLHIVDGEWTVVGTASTDGTDNCDDFGMQPTVGADLAICEPGPPVPLAPRDPTRRETRSIARSAKIPARCLRISVSREYKGWASWELRSVNGACRRVARRVQTTDAIVFVRKTSGRWRRRGSTSQCSKPPGVPSAVFHEILACEGFNDDGTPVS